jgi:hypothetical protein
VAVNHPTITVFPLYPKQQHNEKIRLHPGVSSFLGIIVIIVLGIWEMGWYHGSSNNDCGMDYLTL